MAPIVRKSQWGDRQIEMMRWGMPCPPQYGGAPVTNIRNVKSLHWWRWPKAKKVPTWFAGRIAGRSAFAGIWTPWTGIRGTKANPVEGDHRLFGFLTTEANDIVCPIHAKAMPVLLTTDESLTGFARHGKGCARCKAVAE
jgi:putative SOS response-associated peptidase YedK